MMGRPDYFYKVQIVESGDSGFKWYSKLYKKINN
jgi:hypothetical protein